MSNAIVAKSLIQTTFGGALSTGIKVVHSPINPTDPILINSNVSESADNAESFYFRGRYFNSLTELSPTEIPRTSFRSMAEYCKANGIDQLPALKSHPLFDVADTDFPPTLLALSAASPAELGEALRRYAPDPRNGLSYHDRILWNAVVNSQLRIIAGMRELFNLAPGAVPYAFVDKPLTPVIVEPAPFDLSPLGLQWIPGECHVRGFYMHKYPVTEKEWQIQQGSNEPVNLQNQQRPVVRIMHPEAMEYVKWLNERDYVQELLTNLEIQTGNEWKFDLPNAIEWQIAAKGENGMEGCMIGNVREWLRDFDILAPRPQALVHPASFNTDDSNESLRAYSLVNENAYEAHDDVGFRIVLRPWRI